MYSIYKFKISVYIIMKSLKFSRLKRIKYLNFKSVLGKALNVKCKLVNLSRCISRSLSWYFVHFVSNPPALGDEEP